MSARHARVAAGFVEENEPSRVEQEHQQEEDTSQCLDPRGALLRSYERLFLSLSPSRRSARQADEELVMHLCSGHQRFEALLHCGIGLCTRT